MRETRDIIKVASIYMASIIGAGFASGQEIVQFFSKYYDGGFYGIVLAGILFAVIGYVVLNKVYTERIKNYDELLIPAVGWFVGMVVQAAGALFMLAVFCIMVAGAGNVFVNKLGMNFIHGVILMAIICMIVLLTDIKGIVTLSSIITPVLIVGITVVGIFIIAFKDSSVFNIAGGFTAFTHNWLFSSLIYVGYNSIISIVIMSSLLPNLKTKRVGKLGGIIGGASLCVIALILNSAMMIFHPSSISKELPILDITEKYSGILSGIYSFVLLAAMFTSAVTSGYCFIDRLRSRIPINRKLAVIIVCALVIPLSNLGFSNLISAIYPVFGYVGLFTVLVIFIQGIKNSVLSFRKK